MRILTIEEAIEVGSFHPQYNRRIARGEVIESAIDAAEHVAEGTTRIGGQEVGELYPLVVSGLKKSPVESTSTWKRWLV
jgi:xanthine dehydrogenase molybdopterin-binding subunit B